jgi:hypothetical protein
MEEKGSKFLCKTDIGTKDGTDIRIVEIDLNNP